MAGPANEIGSKAWVEFVRTSPLARNPLGRSRPTQRFAPPALPCSGKSAVAEGGNELTLLLLVDLMFGMGLVKWFKEQPFRLTEADHGIDAVPDMMFEWMSGGLQVVEVKSKRYLNVEEEAKCRRVAGVLEKGAVSYALLTDKDHLAEPLWTNVRNIALAAASAVPPEQIERGKAALDVGPVSIRDLALRGIPLEAVRVLLARGHAFYNLRDRESVNTVVSPTLDPGPYEELFGAKPTAERWWSSLPLWTPLSAGVGGQQ